MLESVCVCVSIHLQAIWENQFYYLFGFLFLVFIILVVSCSQISIVMVYFQLCAEVSSLIAYCCLWLPGFYLTYTHISHIVGYVFHLCGTYLYYMSKNLCTALSLSSSLSGLPVVVENFPGFRRLGFLCPCLRHFLLCQQGKKHRVV